MEITSTLLTNNEDKAALLKKSQNEQSDIMMRMLMAQLNNQDPSDPMKMEGVSKQLTAIQALKGQNSINDTLERLIKVMIDRNNVPDSGSLMNFIGKNINYTHDYPINTGEGAEWEYQINQPDGAPKPTRLVAKIYDLNSGEDSLPIRIDEQIIPDNLEPGSPQKFVWDGRNNNGKKAKHGGYDIKLEAYDANGNPIDVQLSNNVDTVKGVGIEDNKYYFKLENGVKIRLNEIEYVYADAANENISQQTIESSSKSNETGDEPEEAQPEEAQPEEAQPEEAQPEEE